MMRIAPRPKPIPRRILVVVAVPRSGSTWLTDMLRSHPSIDFFPTYDVFRALALRGRRYPIDLSGSDSPRWIEVDNSKWEPIPVIEVGRPSGLPSYALEKIHPLFYRNDHRRISRRIAVLQRSSHRVEFVYQVRDPASTVRSFVSYRLRNPDWMPGIAVRDAASHLANEYESLARLHSEYPGSILAMDDLEQGAGHVLNRIGVQLWDARTEPEVWQPIDEAVSLLANSRRTGVFRQQRGGLSDEQFVEYCSQNVSAFRRMDKLYQDLLTRK